MWTASHASSIQKLGGVFDRPRKRATSQTTPTPAITVIDITCARREEITETSLFIKRHCTERVRIDQPKCCSKPGLEGVSLCPLDWAHHHGRNSANDSINQGVVTIRSA